MTIYRGDLYRKASRRLNPRYRDAILTAVGCLILVALVAFILWDTFRVGGNFDAYFGLVNHAN